MNLKHHQQIFSASFDPFDDFKYLADASHLVNEPTDMRAVDRLLVYRHSITAAQQRVLAMVYPVCKQILGDDCFDTLARDYAWHACSNSSDLNSYGENFPLFMLAQIKHNDNLKELPYLADLIRLEWCWHQSLYAADDPVFDLQALQQHLINGNSDLILQTSHALALIESPWPLMELWQLHQNEEQQAINIEEQTQYLAVSRHNETTCLAQLEPEVYQFLRYAQQGMTLEAIADKLERKAAKTFAKLTQMIQYGWITGLRSA